MEMTQDQEVIIAQNIGHICGSPLVQQIIKMLGVKIEVKPPGERSNKVEEWINIENQEKALDSLSNEQTNLGNVLKFLEEQFEYRIKGQNEMIRILLMALVLNEHVLLEGLPGVGKTEIIKWIAHVTGLPFTRVQFIPDMLPSDLIGKERIDVEKLNYHKPDAVKWVSGPIFSSLVLADEINRAPSKVQAALLEAMGEKQVTPFGKSSRPVLSPLHQAALELWPQLFNDQCFSKKESARGLLNTPVIPIPAERRDLTQFTVFATMNPIEQEGTYPLSEAQLDRFCFKTLVPYPPREEYIKIQSIVNCGEKPADAAEINLSVEVCREYFEKHPKHMIPVLLPVYFFLKSRANILPVKINGDQICEDPLLWKESPSVDSKDSRIREENDQLQRIHDIVYMTNARRTSSSNVQGDSGWYDREQINMLRYIERATPEGRKKRLREIWDAEHCQYVKAGASPRGFLKLPAVAACRALIKGQPILDDTDIKEVVHDVLRHRIHMDVHARLAGVTAEDVINNVCEILMR